MRGIDGISGIWRGNYFRRTPVSITAFSEEGYRFVGWAVSSDAATSATQTDDALPGARGSARLEIALDGDTTVLAEFEPERK